MLNSPDSAPGFAALTPPGSTWSNELCARVALAPPYRLARKVRRIPCPTLYCLTEDDDINPPALGRLAAERVPRGELRLYPGGHFDPFLGENLERMAADQVEFLRAPSGRRRRLELSYDDARIATMTPTQRGDHRDAAWMIVR